MTTRRVCISRAQRDVHVASEAVAVLVALPFLAAVASSRSVPAWARAGAAALALGTLVVDGSLLAAWALRSSES